MLIKHGFLVSLLCFVLTNGIFLLTILYIPNNSYIDERIHFKWLNINNVSFSNFYIYFLSVFRRLENYNYIVITYFVYICAKVLGLNYSIYTIVIPSIIGLFAYVRTDSIRYLNLKMQYNIRADYFNLILSQFIHYQLLK